MNEKEKDHDMTLIKSCILDGMRQVWFPAEFRIAPPALPLSAPEIGEADFESNPVAPPVEQKKTSGDWSVCNQLVAEFATCLWYLKTKHFKREWDTIESNDDDPRVRRALSRLNHSIETLKESGIEVQDPTSKRYPQGGEGMMRPIQFLPTDGLSFETVSETITPIVYRDDRLIQRGEVFVAVPREGPPDGVKTNNQPIEPNKESLDSD